MGISFLFMRYDPFIANYLVDIKKQSISFESRDGLTIKAVLYYPINYNSSELYPAIVSVHGINSRQEALIRLNLEFCRRGFFVLGLNLRGHGGSEGTCTLSKDEPYDIMGAIDYLYTISQVNKSAIGVIGHSLGAMSCIRAAFNDSRIKSTIAIAPPASIDILLSYYIENLDYGIVQKLLGLDFNLTDPNDMFFRSPMNWVNETRPNNLLIQVGNADIIAKDDILILRNATNNNTAEVGKLYGNFTLGTARQYKIYYRNPGIEHEEEARIPEIIIDAILWTEKSLMGHEQGTLNSSDLLKWPDYNFGQNLFKIGLVLSLLPIISYVGTWIIKKQPIDKKNQVKEVKLSSKKIDLIRLTLYFTAYILSSIFVFQIVNFFNVQPWTPYNVSGAFLILFTIRACLLLLALIPIILIEMKVFKIKIINSKKFTQNLGRSVIFSILLSTYVIIMYYYIEYLPTMSIPLIYFPISFIIMILNFTGIFYIDELYNRLLISSIIKADNFENKRKKYIKIIELSLIIGVIGGISYGLIFSPLGISVLKLGELKISFMIIAVIIGFSVSAGFGFFNGILYLKTKNIITGAIFQSIMITWFTATFLVVL